MASATRIGRQGYFAGRVRPDETQSFDRRYAYGLDRFAGKIEACGSPFPIFAHVRGACPRLLLKIKKPGRVQPGLFTIADRRSNNADIAQDIDEDIGL
ncbi:hypothetical protein ACNHKD_09305 [Methylocystis sp. JAN1]|uniref:hypothetical protein n=1 Tax=Methylocystis sp. JAN1 TaxID=3397211 RepID=UPI003FA2F105